MINTPENINIFIAYTQEDRPALLELEAHLSVLERLRMVDKIWYDGMVQVGANWEDTVLDALHNADIILLLVSADFIASDFCYHQEMLQAVELHEAGKVKTLPIIVRPCLWQKAPFAKLKPILPQNGTPVGSKSWQHEDEPYVEITEEIERIILALKQQQAGEKPIAQSVGRLRSLDEAEHYFVAGKWAEAKAKYLEASKTENREELELIKRRMKQCRNEIFFQSSFKRGELAYDESRYGDAFSAFSQALLFKSDDEEAKRLKAAAALGMESPREEEKPIAPKEKEVATSPKPKFFQIEIFGIPIIKLVMAFSLMGLLAIPISQWLNPEVHLFAQEEGDAGTVFVNANGEKVLETSYPRGRDFSKGLGAVKNENEKWGFINDENEVVIDFEYEVAWPHSKEGLAYVKKGDKCGFIDTEGKEQIPLTYLDAASFSEGLAMVKKGPSDFAFIDKNGKEVISGLEAVLTEQFKNNEAVVVRDNRRITIDRKGNCVEGCFEKGTIELDEKERQRKIERLKKDIERLREEEEYERGVMKLEEWSAITTRPAEEEAAGNQIDLLQRKIIERDRVDYDRLFRMAEPYFQKGDFITAKKFYEQALASKLVPNREAEMSLALCEKHIEMERDATGELYGFLHPNELWGIKNQDREVIVAPQYEAVGNFANGFIAVQEEGLWGFLNEEGNVVIKPFYEQVGAFTNEGMARVMKNGKKGFIDRNGRRVRPRK